MTYISANFFLILPAEKSFNCFVNILMKSSMLRTFYKFELDKVTFKSFILIPID